MSYSYSYEYEKVTLTMSVREYQELLVMLGYAVGAARDSHPDTARQFLALINSLNSGSPNFTPYQIPEVSKPQA